MEHRLIPAASRSLARPLGKAIRPRAVVVSVAARLVLGTVMLVAGLVKLPDPAATVDSVRAYELLPASVIPLVGYSLPIGECVLGVLLLLGLFTRTAAALTAVLQVAFIIAIVSVWVRGIEINCGCFGGANTAEPSQYHLDVARDVLFAVVACWLVKKPASKLGLDRFLLPASK